MNAEQLDAAIPNLLKAHLSYQGRSWRETPEVKYDDSSWHSGSDSFPPTLPTHAGATHIGMFFSWCILNGLGSAIHGSGQTELNNRTQTPGQFFLKECDGKLTSEDLNSKGNAFARAYYENNMYLELYEKTLDPSGELESLYGVADNWRNYDVLANVLSQEFQAWSTNTDDEKTPAEQFEEVCLSVADGVKEAGYKFSKRQSQLSRKKDGFQYKIQFWERESYSKVSLEMAVGSKYYKEWADRNGDPNSKFFIQQNYSSLLRAGSDNFELIDPAIAGKIEREIRTIVEPFFSRFLDVENLIKDIVDQQFPGWNVYSALKFVACFGDIGQARQVVTNFLQDQASELSEEYRRYYNSFDCERNVLKGGLPSGGDLTVTGLPAAGLGWAKEIAIASHILNLGDLSKK